MSGLGWGRAEGACGAGCWVWEKWLVWPRRQRLVSKVGCGAPAPTLGDAHRLHLPPGPATVFLPPPEFPRPVRQALFCPRLSLFLSRLVCFSGSRPLPSLTFSLLLNFSRQQTWIQTVPAPGLAHPWHPLPFRLQTPPPSRCGGAPAAWQGQLWGEGGAREQVFSVMVRTSLPRPRRSSGTSSRSPPCGASQKGKLPNAFGERQKSPACPLPD